MTNATVTIQPTTAQQSFPANVQPGKLRCRLLQSGIPKYGPIYQEPPEFGQPFVFTNVAGGVYTAELMRLNTSSQLIGSPYTWSITVPNEAPPPILVDVPVGGAADFS